MENLQNRHDLSDNHLDEIAPIINKLLGNWGGANADDNCVFVNGCFWIIQSMSRKGNSVDNGLIENFFGILKSEMFYGQERTFLSTEHLILEIQNYIKYYNHDRIKAKLKGLSPVNFRIQSA